MAQPCRVIQGPVVLYPVSFSLLHHHLLSLAAGLTLGHGRIDFPPHGKGREMVEERRGALRHSSRVAHLSCWPELGLWPHLLTKEAGKCSL